MHECLKGIAFSFCVSGNRDIEEVHAKHYVENFHEYYPQVVRSVEFWYSPGLNHYSNVAPYNFTDLVDVLARKFEDLLMDNSARFRYYEVVLKLWGRALGVEERLSKDGSDAVISFAVEVDLPDFCLGKAPSGSDDEVVLAYFWYDKKTMESWLRRSLRLTLDDVFNERFDIGYLWVVAEYKYHSKGADIRYLFELV